MGEIIRKISAKTLYGKITPPPEGEVTWLHRVSGTVVAVEEGEGKGALGKYYRLMGDFVLLKFESGEEFESTDCFLPGNLAKHIYTRLQKEGVTEIEFTLDIGVKGSSESPTKYEYVWRNPEKPRDNSRMEKLKKLPMPPGMKALPMLALIGVLSVTMFGCSISIGGGKSEPEKKVESPSYAPQQVPGSPRNPMSSAMFSPPANL